MSRNRSVLPTIPPPRVDGSIFLELQKAFDERRVSGVTQPKTTAIACTHQEIVNDRVHGCGGLAAVRIVDEEACPNCEKITKHVHDILCLGHGALMVSDKLRSPQASFFDKPAQLDREEPAEEEEAESVIDGTTGAPIAATVPVEAEKSYDFEPMPEDERLCVCGFEIASPLVAGFHDKRHASYLSTIDAPDEVRTEAKRRVRKAADVTKVVSSKTRAAAKKARGGKRGAHA